MVDTEPLSQQAWNGVLADFGCKLDDALYAEVVGRAGLPTARIFCDHFQLALPPADLARRAGMIWRDLIADGVPMMPGLEELQLLLRERKISWAVATASPRMVAEVVVKQLAFRDDCVAIAARDDVVNAKPAPDVYLLAAAHLDVPPGQCLALEDSFFGAQSAVAAGMTTYAVPGPHTTGAAFDFVDGVFDSLTQVTDHVRGLLDR